MTRDASVTGGVRRGPVGSILGGGVDGPVSRPRRSQRHEAEAHDFGRGSLTAEPFRDGETPVENRGDDRLGISEI
ncbi:hypothetical protein BRD22_02490 [Halobacteriales archaeon SW_8_68_21]|nr:MAG: hypothetical protein BRD22_02490 [Halobacteriales archaeon SW_8_68_21]